MISTTNGGARGSSQISHQSGRSVDARPWLRAGAMVMALACGVGLGCTVGPRPGTDSGDTPFSDSGAPPGSDASMSVDSGTVGTDAGPMVATCSPAGASSCGNPASILRGVVRLAPGLTPSGTTGTLFIGLTHFRLGDGSFGGVLHTTTTIPGVNLASGTAEFALDMCTGGEMWSEENCEFNLIAVLDLNGNNGSSNFLPDPGEASARSVITVSCAAASPCFDVALDCTDGASCTTFADPGGCSCGTPSCPSIFMTCS